MLSHATRDTSGTGDTSPQALRELLGGFRRTQMVYVAARLGLPDLLAAGPRHSADLAAARGVHPLALHRLLRGLVVLGVVAETDDGRFALAPLGRPLLSEAPDSLRAEAILFGEEFYPAWGSLLYSVETGQPAARYVFGQDAWEYRAAHPELNEHFNRFMMAMTGQVADALLAAYDFSPFHTVADVGGGHGALLAAILRAHAHLAGVLFDQPHVLAGAQACLAAAGVASRCRLVAGDFFERVPPGADAYVLKWIIHDWDDDRSLAILRTCRAAIRGDGKVLLVERLLPARAEQAPGTIWGDLLMLVLQGGRERTEAEYRALLAAAGLTLARVVPTRSDFSVLEAVPHATESTTAGHAASRHSVSGSSRTSGTRRTPPLVTRPAPSPPPAPSLARLAHVQGLRGPSWRLSDAVIWDRVSPVT